MPNQARTSIEPLLAGLLSGLIRHSSDLEVLCDYEGTSLIEFSARVNLADYGRACGKGGKHLRALKAIVALAGLRFGCQALLTEIRQPKRGVPGRMPPYQHRKDWPQEPIKNLLAMVFRLCLKDGAVEIRLTERDERGLFTVVVGPEESDEHLAILVPAVQTLFLPIGMNVGCILNVDVKKV